MKFRFGLHDPLDTSDPSDSFWDMSSEFSHVPQFRTPEFRATAPESASPPGPVVVPAEAAEAQAAVSGSGSGGVGSVIAETSGGLTINLIFDSAAMAAPASFRAGIEQAAALLSAAVSDRITLNFQIDYSGTGGGAAAGPDNGQWESYSSIRADLTSHASAGDQTFNALPTGSTIQGQSSVAVWNAQLKLWGLLGANNTTTDDGSATFATDINPNLLVGVALHELTHAMGRVPYGPQPDIFDFDRFTSSGVRLFSNGSTAPAAYFSLDGGNTKIANYGQASDPSDFLNSGVQGANDPFNEFYTSNTLQQLTTVDLRQLDALGYHLMPVQTTIIQTDGATSLVQLGSIYLLNNINTGTGPELKYGGAPVTVGEFGNVAPIGAVQTSTGYDIAWKTPGTDQFTFMTTDSNGNYTSNIVGWVPGASLAVESLETVFGQDFNGDGTIGVTASLVQTDKSTSLLEIANNYYLYVGGSGPSLKFGGSPMVVGQLGTVAPIGAVQTATGFDIAWKNSATGEFAFTTADSNGNYTSNLSAWVASTSFATESLEAVFGQDFNGDGTVGVTASLIRTDVSTSLLQIADNYYLYVNGSGPSLKLGGAPMIVGQLGTVAPIGAIQTATGFDIAWKDSGTGQFTFTTADGNGNYTSNLSGWVSPTSPTVLSFETVFHQDFNGNSTIGASTPAATSTAIVQTDAPRPEATKFDGTALTLEQPSTFSGQMIGFTANGAAGANQIDLRGLNASTVNSTFDSSSGMLSVTDGSTNASLHFLGQYSQDSFHFANDGNGGTLIVAAAPPGQTGAANQVANLTAHDTFVFAPNFGQVSLAHFVPMTDTLQFSKTVFADLTALLAATHDDVSGNAVIADAAHDTITLQHVTTAQLLAHQSDFHFA